MDEASKRVTSVLDEFQKKTDDFQLDTQIKMGAGALVGLSFGILTKRFIRIRTSVIAGTCLGAGTAVERYSQQLSAPYVEPPSCEIALATSRVFGDTWRSSMPTMLADGCNQISSLFATSEPSESPPPSTPAVESSDSVPVDEPTSEEPVKDETTVDAPENAVAEEAPVDAVSLEEIAPTDDAVSQPEEPVSIVDAVAAELKKELHDAAAEVETIAEEIEVVAADVVEVAEVVEEVAEKVEPIVPAAQNLEEAAAEVETVAENVEAVAEKTAEIAAEVKEATE